MPMTTAHMAGLPQKLRAPDELPPPPPEGAGGTTWG